MFSLGIDIGYSSVTVSLIDKDGNGINRYKLHHGRVKNTLLMSIKEIEQFLAEEKSEGRCFCAVTGSGHRLISDKGLGVNVNETAAVIEGVSLLKKDAGAIIEIGGESAKYITGIKPESMSGVDVSMNSNCSAGTGSFLEEQISRLALQLEDYSEYAEKAKSIPRIAGRCSVFAKTDITHHQQEGVPVEDILLGLAYAVVKNFKGTIIKRQQIVKPVVFVGGVGFNHGIVSALYDVLKLKEDELIVPDDCGNIGAIGAALIGFQEKHEIDISSLVDFLEQPDCYYEESETGLTPLSFYGDSDGENRHIINSPVIEPGETVPCFMGVDIGSTSTNVVLIDLTNRVIGYKYVRTHGNPVSALERCFYEIEQEWNKRLTVKGVGVTGSGRYMIGEMIGADVIKDEITAQASAAILLDEEVDTVFEIGGQDSKFIMLDDGRVKDFQMNKVCAAGTGSFIEEQAKKFDIEINNFGPLALEGENPVDLGERCTVFIESSIGYHLSHGASLENLAAGLCYSIAKNYLNRVVGKGRIGKKIFLQGGIAHNQGVVNAFRVLTNKDIIVPDYFSVTGAYGAALIASNEVSEVSAFKGFKINPETYNKKSLKKNNNSIFNKRVNDLVFQGYDGKKDPEKRTIGIPRALFTFGMYPLFNAIFNELGFNVVLSDPTSEKTIELGQEFTQDELCYPMKLINGHVAELINKKVDYIFFPDLHSVEHLGSPSRQNYGCAYMQLAFKIIKQNMDLETLGIKLLSPTIAFNMGKEFMKKSLSSIGALLGKSRKETDAALQKGMQAALNFEERLEKNGKKGL